MNSTRTAYKEVSVLIIGLVLVAAQGGFSFFGGEKVDASSVTVSATVSQTVTCTTGLASTAFGTLSSGSITTASPNATTSVATNDGNGMTLSVADNNAGLATTSPAYTIPSASVALAAGTEGYGIQATSSNSQILVAATYNKIGNNVGALATSTAVLASSTAVVSGSIVTVTHMAAISATTQAASYTDTITYSCTGK